MQKNAGVIKVVSTEYHSTLIAIRFVRSLNFTTTKLIQFFTFSQHFSSILFYFYGGEKKERNALKYNYTSIIILLYK